MRRKHGFAAHCALAVDLLLTVLALTFSGCSGSSPTSQQGDPQVTGNWQFTMSTSSTTSFIVSPLQGGFLLQNNGAITGQIQFSIVVQPATGAPPVACNSGIAPVTGTISGQTVSLAAAIGALGVNGNPITQTLALSGGTLSSDGTTIQNGTYTLTPGSQCGGGAQDVGTWRASLVPPLTGGFQGFFHSVGEGSFANQNFPVSGTFTQGPNIGAATATVTGTLLFQDSVSLLNDYPCLTTASVNGTISGNNVSLQIFSTGGTLVGQVGQAPPSFNNGTSPFPVSFDSARGGYVVHNLQGAAGNKGGYILLPTKSCSLGDLGNLCLALGGSNACNQPVLLTPFSLTFPPQLVGSAATSQTITLSNTYGSALSGLKLRFGENDSTSFYKTGGDFNGVPNFTEQDNCTQQGSISLDAGASCTVTIFFSPQESCPWLPQAASGGVAPARCPITLIAGLTITVPSGSADADKEFSAPISGTGLSTIVPSVPEIDFGAEALGEASPPHTLTFSNQGPNPVTILPSMSTPCPFTSENSGQIGPPIPRPPISKVVPGLQLGETSAGIQGGPPITPISSINPPLVNAPTVGYFCDPLSSKGGGGGVTPNLQISRDECSGQTLAPFGQSGNSCSLEITFVPQSVTWSSYEGGSVGLDDFLQLNTAWCGDANNPPEPNCVVDSGRFAVEVKTNPASPLRMFPSAGMDFGTVLKGTASAPLTITIFSDPVDPNAGPVTFTSKLVTGADFIEADNCPPTLASNQSCAVTVTFTPTISGLEPNSYITFTYNTATEVGLTQTIYLRGTGQ